MTATVTSFPLSKHTGGSGTTPTFSGRLVYLQFMWEVPLPHSPVELSSQQPLLQAFLLQGCWACAATPAFSGWLFYLKFHEGLPLPHLWHSGLPALFDTCLFCCWCLLFSLVFFSLFSLGGGQSVQGAMLIWPRVVGQSTSVHLAHLVVCFSRAGRSWHLVAQEPSWFLHLTWSGDATHGLWVWR
jgi:hypothetical protein